MRLSRERPHCPIIALTPELWVARRLCVVWGVFPHLINSEQSTQGIEPLAGPVAELARNMGFCKTGDRVLILAGLPSGHSGSTNTLRVITA